MQILIIDDEKEIADNLVDFLDELATRTASYSAKDASELLSIEKFDLVITDIDMSKSDNIGGGERILSEMSARETPIWVYTGGNENRVDEFLRLGAKEVFFKPDMEKIYETVRSMIRKKTSA